MPIKLIIPDFKAISKKNVEIHTVSRFSKKILLNLKPSLIKMYFSIYQTCSISEIYLMSILI